MRTPALITGMGAISPAGLNADALWNQVLSGKPAVQDGRCAFSSEQWAELFSQLRKSEHFQGMTTESRSLLLSLLSIEQATAQAGWKSIPEDTGLILATTTGDIHLWEPVLMQYFEGHAALEDFAKQFVHEPLGHLVSEIQNHLPGLKTTQLVTSACAASTHALCLALDWIRLGKVKRCLVGGVEVLCRLLVDGFGSFQLLSSEPCLPFDTRRQGINLAEGAGFLCLEHPDFRVSGTPVLGKLLGAGISSDSFHMTSPHPEGAGAYRAMKMALDDSETSAEDLDWVHAHGTGSLHNDQAEAQAISTLGVKRAKVTSTKRIHGHALAASGTLESVLCLKALETGICPPCWNLEKQDDTNPLQMLRQPEQLNPKIILKSSLGFGGVNGAVVLAQGGER